jgi:FtsH-binding integral membrane protein
MLANLRALLAVIVDIVLLRRGPDSLPTSRVLLFAFALLYLVVAGLSQAALPQPPPLWPVQLLIGIIVLLLSFHLAFTAARKRERFVQTLTAVFAVSALFAPALTPMLTAVMQQSKQPQTASGALLVLTMGIAVWMFVIQIRIVRAALEWPIFGVIIFICAQELLGAIIFVMLFGASAATA